jgi:hypothetical protein
MPKKVAKLQGPRLGVEAEVFVFTGEDGEFLVRPALVAIQAGAKVLFWNFTKSDVLVTVPGPRRATIAAGGQKSVVINKPRGVYAYEAYVDIGRGRGARARGDSPPRVVIRP